MNIKQGYLVSIDMTDDRLVSLVKQPGNRYIPQQNHPEVERRLAPLVQSYA